MPGPRANNAPVFSGKLDDSIADFIVDFEALADGQGLNDAQKVEMVGRYISKELREFWKTLDGHGTGDWAAFRTALEKVHPDVRAASRLSKRGLFDFIDESAQSHICDEEDVIRYCQDFLCKSNPLRLANRITEEECSAECFQGFHPVDRDIIAARLFSSKPNHPLDQPYDLEDVYNIARGYFSNSQFY
ncbi:hypothetical protein F5148DRAFT_981774 [Russula earlei]|uniref:Uncharacterized protein n=1 Tax=Russula earlei TaxID=71964 RepID=A0ACC0U6B5_9AGAM|nr:hypothetical protein F5148DRAFT_981774 [Russula earlei]